MPAQKTVLIVEDDADIASALARGLGREGYEVVTAYDVQQARNCLHGTHVHAAIVDMMLGEERGTGLIAEMRDRGQGFPVIILSALSGVDDRARGLESGADDYVVKPFAFSELLARLRVQEKRYEDQGATLAFGGLTYDPAIRQVGNGDKSLSLTEKEGRLLEVFLKNPRRLFGRNELFEMLWAADGRTSENVVDVYVGYLRRKLRPIADTKAQIITVRGKGFMLSEATDDTT